MSRIFWVRHGPTHAKSMVGWSDLPADLSDTEQIARLTEWLPRDAAVISSDLSRAVTTADAIAANRPRLPHDPDLREMNFGDWELLRFDQVQDQAHYRAFWENPGDIRPPGGESWHDMSTRVDRAVTRLLASGAHDTFIVVAHFGVILSQLQHALQIDTTEAFGHRIENLSVTELHRHGSHWRVERFNHMP